MWVFVTKKEETKQAASYDGVCSIKKRIGHARTSHNEAKLAHKKSRTTWVAAVLESALILLVCQCNGFILWQFYVLISISLSLGFNYNEEID